MLNQASTNRLSVCKPLSTIGRGLHTDKRFVDA